MSDDNWPARTPRDEMLTRVAARGSRIRAVRGAMNALVILSVVGASALGVGVVVDSLGDGDGTEVENIAMVPEPPEIGPGSTEPATDPTDGDPTSTTAGVTGSTATTPGSAAPGTPGSTATPGTTGRPGSSSSGGPTSSGGRGSGGGTSTSTSRPTTTAPPASSPSETTTTVPAPEVSDTPRMKGDGVFMDLNVCEGEESVLSVEISGADTAVMSWNRAGETRSQEMTPGETEWSAPLGQIDPQAGDVPILVTIEATGPGGTTRTSVEIPVTDCSPLPSAPSVPGS